MLSASEEDPFQSALILDLQPVCSSKRLEKPLLIGEWGPKVQVPEVWLPAG